MQSDVEMNVILQELFLPEKIVHQPRGRRWIGIIYN